MSYSTTQIEYKDEAKIIIDENGRTTAMIIA